MNLTVFGLQRSGTNFLETIFKTNVNNVKVLNTNKRYIWKHVDSIDLSKIRHENCHVYITKSPYNWIESILRKQVDILRKRPWIEADNTTKIRINGLDVERLADVWNYHMKNFHTEQYIQSLNYDKIQYEKLIESKEVQMNFVDKVCFRHDMQRRYSSLDSFNVPTKVPQSDVWNERRKEAYLDEKLYLLEWDHIQAINKRIEDDVVDIAGYKKINSIEEYNQKKTHAS